MALKERLAKNLVKMRQMSERMLADFHTPEEWVHQVHPGCNHALWFAGHMAQLDNFFISLVAPDRVKQLDEFPAKFGMGSQPTNRPADYPPADSVVETMRERRGVLLDVLDSLTDDDLVKKLPPGTPDFLSDVGSVFEMAIWHEGQHRGQISVVRRALGHKPLT